MAKSIIVYGVPGGKTRFAQRIADHFGLRLADRIFDCDHGIEVGGLLYFSEANEKPSSVYNEFSRSFQEVADEINAAISLTDWQSGPPPMVGEYDTLSTYDREPVWRRYWNGEVWSYAFRESYNQFQCNMKASKLQSPHWRPEWRGLSAEPIKVTE